MGLWDDIKTGIRMWTARWGRSTTKKIELEIRRIERKVEYEEGSGNSVYDACSKARPMIGVGLQEDRSQDRASMLLRKRRKR